jgi:hypothetical protein
MFIATTLAYPCILAVLCAGAGLLVDRCSGGLLPAPLLLTVGAAALIALSQLTTWVSWAAPATPLVMAAAAVAGLALGRVRIFALARLWPARMWLLCLPLMAYALALAPVLLAGRTSFSSFMALSDSAVHMVGADFLLRHGQDYAHLDLRNSYGLFINGYYNTSYPSGADTLFGASASLLGLPLIWAFQPFNAFMLATAVGPAWLLARRIGLHGLLAAGAALSVTVPALVYGYELIGSIKEIVALPMILTLGALVVLHPRWLWGAARCAIPFALVTAAGVSALGVGFAPWVLVAVAVLLATAVLELPRARGPRARGSLGGLLALTGAGAAVLLLAAWPTWRNLSGSLQVASTIASTGNPGNLHSPLRPIQALGIWLRGSYKLAPAGFDLVLTYALISLALLAALLGVARLIVARRHALGAWIALMLVAWLVIESTVTTWVGAKTLMLTSPVVLLLVWGGVAALRSAPRRWLSRLAAPALALLLTAGVLASDAMQYHSSNLAPTARYRELASLDSRLAGRGPALFTDFDEYSLYELRDLDLAGPDFAFPPPALAAAAGGYGQPVDLDRVSPAALLGYPLIITRRDPMASRPPAAYRMLWQGAYYEVWARRARARVASAHLALKGTPAEQCSRIGRLARSSGPAPRLLIAAVSPQLIRISLRRASRPAAWGRQRQGLVMSRPGRLQATFRVPLAGLWSVWVQGQIMPTVDVAVDGHTLASIAGELSGNSLVPGTVPPLAVRLSAGAHRLSVTRRSSSLAPGDGGSAVLAAIFLTPAGFDRQALRVVAPSRWQALCGRRYAWVELAAG